MKAPKSRYLLLMVVLLVLGGGAPGYWILLSPGSICVRWAQAAFPPRITMITFGPYPSGKELRNFREKGGAYVASLLDPRLPYEKKLIEREKAEAARDGLIVKGLPMASVFDHRIFSDYQNEEQKAEDFLKGLERPAYVHCYLGKQRVIHVRNALLKTGVPATYWTPKGKGKEYWELVNRLADTRREFEKKELRTGDRNSQTAYCRGRGRRRSAGMVSLPHGFVHGGCCGLQGRPQVGSPEYARPGGIGIIPAATV
jgi:hypothetical protein